MLKYLNSMKKDTKSLAIFEGKRIRKIIHNNEWWFSVIDVVEILTGSDRARKYWNDLKKKLKEEGYNEVSEKIGQLKLRATDGKYYETDCANTETMLRIVQSISSPKVEPLKRWLARLKAIIKTPGEWSELEIAEPEFYREIKSGIILYEYVPRI
ncbi:MAG: hypothetical protein AUJ11_01590 [Parcubacteria group bacterium CG1_02_44_65]|nr:MAG: hypothetical protein AUJ11_01590 [Parcubacteria group bacterium CG1_02_44_65]